MSKVALQIRWHSLQAGGCCLSVRTGDASSSCWAEWPILKEKLRDALALKETDLDRMESELSANGVTRLEHLQTTPAHIRALGLQWPAR